MVVDSGEEHFLKFLSDSEVLRKVSNIRLEFFINFPRALQKNEFLICQMWIINRLSDTSLPNTT